MRIYLSLASVALVSSIYLIDYANQTPGSQWLAGLGGGACAALAISFTATASKISLVKYMEKVTDRFVEIQKSKR